MCHIIHCLNDEILDEEEDVVEEKAKDDNEEQPETQAPDSDPKTEQK